MYWDGSNWVDETPKPTPSLAPRKRGARDWAATGLMGLVLVGLIIPTVGVFAGSGSGGSVAAWSTNYKVTTYQENSASVDWNGHWTRVSYRSYSGGRVRSTDQRGAGATVTFKGTGFAWVGPVGPTRGEAKIYIDGAYVKTVDMYASRYVASTVVFQQLFSGYGTHTFQMVSLATNGHPTVAVDKFIIRGNNKVAVEPVAAEVPAPTATPTAATTSAPTAAPTAAPTSAPTAAPTAAPTSAPTTAPTAAPTAAPTVAPSAGVKTFTTSGTASQLKALIADENVDVIEFRAGTYKLPAIYIDVARSSRLVIRPEAGATVTFTGNGDSTRWGQFYFGLNSLASNITMQGFTFDGYVLDQAGIFEIRSSKNVTITDIKIRNITRGPTSDKAYKTYGAYISMAGGRGNTNLTLSRWNITGSGRTWSGIQIDSSTVKETSIHITDIVASNLAYAFYEDVPTTDLILDGWTITNCGQGDVSVNFHQASGVYRNLKATGSEGLPYDTGNMVDGGGNSGL